MGCENESTEEGQEEKVKQRGEKKTKWGQIGRKKTDGGEREKASTMLKKQRHVPHKQRLVKGENKWMTACDRKEKIYTRSR